MTVYITTRDRLANLEKIIPRWLGQDMQVNLVVEESEVNIHRLLVSRRNWQGVKVISLGTNNRGIGYARRFAVNHASEYKLDTIIMSDDDMRPSMRQDMSLLLEEAKDDGVIGIGAVRGIHDRFSKGVVALNSGLILCPGGWGAQLFALNVRNTIEVGNFEAKLDCFGEDHELMRQGIAQLGIPWLVHCGVKCDPIGVRYDPGGINSLINDGTRGLREIACRELIHRRWPDYTSAAAAKPRMRWQKMLDDYIPDWRSRSAIHGGQW